MTELLDFLQEVALLALAGVAVVMWYMMRRINSNTVEIEKMRARLDSGDKKFDEMMGDLKVMSADIKKASNDIAHILGILEHHEK